MSLREFATAVADRLDGFYVIEDRGHLWLAHPDGRRLVVRSDGQRIAITGCYPSGGRPSDPEPRITVDPDRDPAAAAGVIAQRFLPRYARALAQARASITKHAADEARRVQIAARLARTLRAEVGTGTPGHTIIHWSGSRLAGTPATGSGSIDLLEDASTAHLHAYNVPTVAVERFVAALASLATDSSAASHEQP